MEEGTLINLNLEVKLRSIEDSYVGHIDDHPYSFHLVAGEQDVLFYCDKKALLQWAEHINNLVEESDGYITKNKW